jgi:indolepyruvate ferredoxin oxidoreductase
MASPTTAQLPEVHIDDKYVLDEGRIFVTGIQALVRLPMLQHTRDKLAGLHTAGFISGYRGSPLGALDQQLRRAEEFLDPHDITFVPGVNEDLAATSLWGTQQAELGGEGRYDGVFGMWYGKGPGVDRSGDALRHANLAGTSPNGGVVALLGDDHACESSTTANQSEYAMVDAMIPVLNPAGVQDILDYGLYGWALSRFSGCWTALKCVHDTVEATASVQVSPERARAIVPQDYPLPPGGLNIRWPDTPQQQEQRLHELKQPAVLAFARANALDRVVMDASDAHFGIITTGKSYLDVRAALAELGIDAAEARRLGIRLYKVAMPWPLEPQGVREFCRGLQHVVVVEEKRGLIEEQLKNILYSDTQRPQVVGKRDEDGDWLFPSAGRLGSAEIALALGKRLVAATGDATLRDRLAQLREATRSVDRNPPPALRTPYFCSGCPHNTSTKVPQGSKALAGIGCHYMALWMNRNTERFTQMGAEGASWMGEARFSKRGHVFQNIGDGTYYHSGLLAIRATVAAGVNITYKILYNDAVAMTGGQPMDGPLDVIQVSWQVHAEGARKIAVVTDEPHKYPAGTRWPPEVKVYHRDKLDAVQREFREIPGTTVIIYDQTCAAEKRRRRKRGQFPDPPRRMFINEAVCEGCGDCGVQSNCVAIVPVSTKLGRKRQIDQSACNKDYSCVKGFCPSFVTVHGGSLRKRTTDVSDAGNLAPLPEPKVAEMAGTYRIVLAGVGGTGVVTIGALLGMAAHVADKACSVLDMMGLAQKGGAVLSHIILAQAPEDISATHVPTAGADLLLGGDILVAASPQITSTLRRGATRAVINTHEMMTGDFARDADHRFPSFELRERLTGALGDAPFDFINTTQTAARLFGDSIAANLLLVGFAYQRGFLPLPQTALLRAIELNGVAVELNKQAFEWGRRVAHDPDSVSAMIGALDTPAQPHEPGLDEVLAERTRHLVGYQSERYARRYRKLVAAMRGAENAAGGGEELTTLVAHNYHKLLAYKDEYEVARLYSDGEFERRLNEVFEGDYRLEFHLAPPLFAKQDPLTGLPKKQGYGAWMMRAFKLLARARVMRGTPFDPFAYTAERRMERRLIGDYEKDVRDVCESLTGMTREEARAKLNWPASIRGFGHVKQASIDALQGAGELQSAPRSN